LSNAIGFALDAIGLTSWMLSELVWSLGETARSGGKPTLPELLLGVEPT